MDIKEKYEARIDTLMAMEDILPRSEAWEEMKPEIDALIAGAMKHKSQNTLRILSIARIAARRWKEHKWQS